MRRGRVIRSGVAAVLLLLVVGVVGVLHGPLGGRSAPATQARAPEGVAALVDSAAPDDALRDGQFCGGSLVSGRVVLTANHCVEDMDPEDVDVVLGVEDLCAEVASATTRTHVEQIVTGPEGSDSAALILSEATTRTPFLLPETVPPLPFEASSYGWGDLTSLRSGPCSVKTISLTFEELSACDRAAELDDPVDPAYGLCARPTEGTRLNTCTGDSGGPSVVAVLGGLEVVGLTDWGAFCNRHAYGGYVSVLALRPWLDPVLAAAESP